MLVTAGLTMESCVPQSIHPSPVVFCQLPITTCPREAAGIISQAEQVISQKADVNLVVFGFVFIVFLLGFGVFI
ncbi:hypothetical protein SBV1_2290003 [Verrucomicrobia bacterium]|nr:hypothetical protein SBV1_2290003 [Verrucomicrobiota bacterium]